MKIIVPDYYADFKCIADKCGHTCCRGWEIDIDEESLARYKAYPDINNCISQGKDPCFILDEDETCPFLDERGLCGMILKYGEDMLCQICRDHPRFNNYWSDRIETGLGLVCEEAARLILTRKSPMKLTVISADGFDEELPEDEKWLMTFRDDELKNIKETGPAARLREYLIYRHIADALYDDRLSERLKMVDYFVDRAVKEWADTDGSTDSLIEIVRKLSYDIEYDDEEKEKLLNKMSDL